MAHQAELNKGIYLFIHEEINVSKVREAGAGATGEPLPSSNLKMGRTGTDRSPSKGGKGMSSGVACLICGKVFQYEHRMKVHVRTHTGETPYACSLCDKSFAQKAALKVHVRTHTGERPFGCKRCDKRFSRADHLNQHARTHTGEKPYSCTLCDKSFATWSAISRHRSEHASRDSYSCSICNKTFSRSDNLRSHVKKTHLKEPVNVEETIVNESEIKTENEAEIQTDMKTEIHTEIKAEVPDQDVPETDPLDFDQQLFGSHFLASSLKN